MSKITGNRTPFWISVDAQVVPIRNYLTNGRNVAVIARTALISASAMLGIAALFVEGLIRLPQFAHTFSILKSLENLPSFTEEQRTILREGFLGHLCRVMAPGFAAGLFSKAAGLSPESEESPDDDDNLDNTWHSSDLTEPAYSRRPSFDSTFSDEGLAASVMSDADGSEVGVPEYTTRQFRYS